MTDYDLFTKESYAGLFIIGSLGFYNKLQACIMIMMVVNNDYALGHSTTTSPLQVQYANIKQQKFQCQEQSYSLCFEGKCLEWSTVTIDYSSLQNVDAIPLLSDYIWCGLCKSQVFAERTNVLLESYNRWPNPTRLRRVVCPSVVTIFALLSQ